jgi:hypothetical protein
MKNSKNNLLRTLIQQQGIIAILVGLILMGSKIYIHESCKPTLEIFCALLSLVEAIGIALVGFGFFGIIIDTRNWRDYFGSRLREVVIEQEYLNGLDVDSLKSLQTKVLKAFFHDSTIDKEGSFLNYFHLNLHRYISEPYREDATKIIVMREVSNGVEIQDTISYTCRKAGGDIQKHVKWAADPNEFRSVSKLKIQVQYPYWHDLKGQWITLADVPTADIDLTNFVHSQSLDEYKGVDGLIVKMESIYVVDLEKFHYWQMAHPTRNFHMSLSFPSEFSIQLKPLVLHPELAQTTISDGYALVKYDTWMLPQSGVAWRFVRKPKLQTNESPSFR